MLCYRNVRGTCGGTLATSVCTPVPHGACGGLARLQTVRLVCVLTSLLSCNRQWRNKSSAAGPPHARCYCPGLPVSSGDLLPRGHSCTIRVDLQSPARLPQACYELENFVWKATQPDGGVSTSESLLLVMLVRKVMRESQSLVTIVDYLTAQPEEERIAMLATSEGYLDALPLPPSGASAAFSKPEGPLPTSEQDADMLAAATAALLLVDRSCGRDVAGTSKRSYELRTSLDGRPKPMRSSGDGEFTVRRSLDGGRRDGRSLDGGSRSSLDGNSVAYGACVQRMMEIRLHLKDTQKEDALKSGQKEPIRLAIMVARARCRRAAQAPAYSAPPTLALGRSGGAVPH